MEKLKVIQTRSLIEAIMFSNKLGKEQYGSNKLEGALPVKRFVPLKFIWTILYVSKPLH